jgi:hypothetical protein
MEQCPSYKTMKLCDHLSGWIVSFQLLIFLLGAPDALARIGVVETRDGRSLHGQIRLSTNGVTVINSSNATMTTVAATNLIELSFDPASTPVPDPLDPRTFSKIPVWQYESVGNTTSRGAFEQTANLFRIRSNGANIAGRADAFQFVFRACTGNCEIVARVVSMDALGEAKAGLMIRESLAPGSPNVFVGLYGPHGGVLQHRNAPGEETALEAKPTMFVPHWVRLKRIGNEFIASSSASGRHWLRSRSIAIPMGEVVFIGMAVATGGQQTLVSALFDNIRQDASIPHTSFIPELRLQSGSVVVGPILSGDSERFQVDSFPFSAPASGVTHIFFRWVPLRYASQVAFGRPGVLLATGEFIEGEFSGLQRDVLTMSSVLYGIKSFDADADVVAVILRRSYEPSQRYTIVTLNGTTLHPQDLQFGDYEIAISENSLGPRKIPLPELLMVRCAR